MFLLAMLPEKPYGFGSCSLTYLIRAWSLLSFIVTTRAVSKYQRILCFTTVSKHMEMRYHYLRDMVQWRAISLRYIPTDEQTADVLTKPLSKMKFEYFRDKLGVVENGPLVEREC